VTENSALSRYYSSKTNTAGIFGDVTAVAGDLIADGTNIVPT
jgi:hypothetical protein